MLQSKVINFPQAVDALKSISEFLVDFRENGFVSSLVKAKELAEELKVEAKFKTPRLRRKKKHFDCEGRDEPLTEPQENLKVEFFLPLVDTAYSAVEEQFEQLKAKTSKYDFLFKLDKLPDRQTFLIKCKQLEELMSDETDQSDIRGDELCDELVSIQKLLPKEVATCLRNVSLLVRPPAVQKGQHAALQCLYDLEEAPLYSVKWYRGNHEFYRYSPSDTPPNKIFPFDGIHVDLSMSNSTQVMLQNVQFKLSGNISCEVSADSPSFSTAIVSRHLMVVDLPDSGPEIHTEKDRYVPGDLLRANCTSPPSKPPASLSFLLNNQPVGLPETQKIPGPDQLQSSTLSLSIQLIPSNFHNGQLVLKCTAIVATLYRESTEIHLGLSPREPIPERVTSPSLASHTSTASVHLLLVLIAFFSSR